MQSIQTDPSRQRFERVPLQSVLLYGSATIPMNMVGTCLGLHLYFFYTDSLGLEPLYLSAVMVRPKNQIRTELYMTGENAKAYYGLLQQQKDEIERELGYPLDWQELQGGLDSRITYDLNDVDPEDKADWPRQHEWLAQRLNEMHRVLAPRVKALDPDQWIVEERRQEDAGV